MNVGDVELGAILVADDGFTCLQAGQRCEVMADDDGLYIECAEGQHYLNGQTDFNAREELVGLASYPVPGAHVSSETK